MYVSQDCPVLLKNKILIKMKAKQTQKMFIDIWESLTFSDTVAGKLTLKVFF